MLNWVFGSKRNEKSARKAPSYEEAKDVAATGSVGERLELAKCEGLPPEFLYYFASDQDDSVRRAVAANPGTPLQADVILAKDREVSVRTVLAEKIAKILPDIRADESEKLAELAFEVLETLAEDQAIQVRQVVADSIKSLDNVPKPIVQLLARDLDEVVSMPVLEYSPLLDEQDLIGLILTGISGKRLAAVSRRQNLTTGLIDAIVETEDEIAVEALIGNEHAEISDQTLNQIVDAAEDREGWQSAIATRSRVKEGTLLRLSRFATASVLKRLRERSDLGPELHTELESVVANRVNNKIEATEPESPDDVACKKAKDLHAEGKLTEREVLKAIKSDDRLYVEAALSVLAEQPLSRIRDILKMKSPKSVLATTWKSGLSIDVAVALQEDTLRLPASKVMRAKGKRQYPISDDDLSWQAELLFD